MKFAIFLDLADTVSPYDLATDIASLMAARDVTVWPLLSEVGESDIENALSIADLLGEDNEADED